MDCSIVTFRAGLTQPRCCRIGNRDDLPSISRLFRPAIDNSAADRLQTMRKAEKTVKESEKGEKRLMYPGKAGERC
jgi:hypothetical protein